MNRLLDYQKLKFSKRQKGFTLIEVFVAVIILGLAYVAILQSFSVSLTNI
ncbi:MAG: type II secretion system protein, partial [Desulfobulbaceae bacterium]|nr:type II secretion system protein [Desulfobulbaceae bacterium]